MKSSTYYFHMKTKILANFQICISVPLRLSNKHDTFWHVVPSGWFDLLFLWAIAVSDFLPFEIYKNLGPPLSGITFTVSSYADNHFYKYIYLFQILYSMKSVFFIKIHVQVFHIQIWFKCEIPPLFFLLKTMVYRKSSL